MSCDLLLSVTLVPELFLGEPCSDRGYCPSAGGREWAKCFGPEVNFERFVKKTGMNDQKIKQMDSCPGPKP